MKAIVLTYDRYRAFTDHMISRYRDLWPDHPFQFRVPYQELGATSSDNIEYRSTPTDIKSTVLALLADLEDEKLVYWCIDDKYPIKLDVPRIRRIHDWLTTENPPDIAGVLCSRFGKLWNRAYLTGASTTSDSGEVLVEMKGYGHIWVHQFIRVRVLRSLFESFPDEIRNAKYMDRLLHEARPNPGDRLFVTRKNLAIYGESTSRGHITTNCYESILENDCALPTWTGKPRKRIVKGEMPETPLQRLRFHLKRSAVMRTFLRRIRVLT